MEVRRFECHWNVHKTAGLILAVDTHLELVGLRAYLTAEVEQTHKKALRAKDAGVKKVGAACSDLMPHAHLLPVISTDLGPMLGQEQ